MHGRRKIFKRKGRKGWGQTLWEKHSSRMDYKKVMEEINET